MFSLAAWADVQVTASAPDVVVVGDQFRLSYKVNTQDIDDFSAPAVSGFDILMGPSRSMQSSFQMINGRTTQSSSVTFTYILNATKAGTYTIGPASVTVNGKKHQSNSLRIQVLPPDKTRSNSSSNSGSSFTFWSMPWSIWYPIFTYFLPGFFSLSRFVIIRL